MRKVTNRDMAVTALFCVSLWIMGYAPFGSHVPGNILVGDHKPFWIPDIANLAVVIHLVTTYKVFSQPMYDAIERYLSKNFPTASFNKPYTIQVPFLQPNKRTVRFTLWKLVMRTLFVIFATSIAMGIPFFNFVVGLLGSPSFWPLTIHSPIKMYTAQAGIRKWTWNWWLLQVLDIACFCVTLIAVVGSTGAIVNQLQSGYRS